MTVAEFLQRFEYSDTFRDAYMVPMIAAIWSVPRAQSMVMPMRTLVRFMVNHHLHRIKNRPSGARSSTAAVSTCTRSCESYATCVSTLAFVAVRRSDDSVVLEFADGATEHFDDVVLATHADVSLALPWATTRRCSSASYWVVVKYQVNRCVLHTGRIHHADKPSAVASWNVKEFQRVDEAASRPICLLVLAQRLQNLPDGVQDVFVTLNRRNELENHAANLRHGRTPVLNSAAIDAQERLRRSRASVASTLPAPGTRYGFHSRTASSPL
ncbi:hypothetical protein PINS_up023656 [Pythium insidiosum]|nr:hypothetical protein PINS_up023656 [Pythium insidiosum]